MIEILALLCLVSALILLIILSIIDLKTFLLPNVFVFPFGALGIIFHLLTDFYYLDWFAMLLGCLFGYGLLFTIRAIGNRYYGQDTLGLGDVKLLSMAGLWLGVEGVLFAMTLGAFFGLIHGLFIALNTKIRTKGPFSIARLTIPAGPGFAAGIICVGGWMYYEFVLRAVG